MGCGDAPCNRVIAHRGSLCVCARIPFHDFRKGDRSQWIGCRQAKILVVEKNTGAKSETSSGADGSYSLPFLTPGPSPLTAELSGFKKYVQEGLNVGTNQRIAIDVALQLGNQVESITVSADVTMLQTATASVGQVIGQNEISVLPMNGRTPLTLAQLSYGVARPLPIRALQDHSTMPAHPGSPWAAARRNRMNCSWMARRT